MEMQLPGIRDALWNARGLGATGKVCCSHSVLFSVEQRGAAYLRQFTAQGSLTCRAELLGDPKNNASLKFEPEEPHLPHFRPSPLLAVYPL